MKKIIAILIILTPFIGSAQTSPTAKGKSKKKIIDKRTKVVFPDSATYRAVMATIDTLKVQGYIKD